MTPSTTTTFFVCSGRSVTSHKSSPEKTYKAIRNEFHTISCIAYRKRKPCHLPTPTTCTAQEYAITTPLLQPPTVLGIRVASRTHCRNLHMALETQVASKTNRRNRMADRQRLHVPSHKQSAPRQQFSVLFVISQCSVWTHSAILGARHTPCNHLNMLSESHGQSFGHW